MTSNEYSLNERKDEYLKIENILERFNKIDRLYNHTPWTLDQIYANLNSIMSEQFNANAVVMSHLEPDNCGNYIVQNSNIENDSLDEYISRKQAKKAIIDNQYSSKFCEEHNIDHSINTGMALIALSDITPLQKITDDDVVLSYDAYHELIADRAEKLDKEDTIDKIRTEIEQLDTKVITIHRTYHTIEREVIQKDRVLEILDKYTESTIENENKDAKIEKVIKILENVKPNMLYYDPDLISCTLDDYMSAVNVALDAFKGGNS